MNRERIFDIQVDNLSFQECIEKIEEYIKSKSFLHVVGINADKINLMDRNLKLKQIIQKSNLVHVDGVSMLIAGKCLSIHFKERCAGIDIMEELLKKSDENEYKIYLLGARQEILDQCVANIKKRYRHINIVGFHNGYFQKADWKTIVQNIKNVNPDIIFVGITSPLKEYLIDYFENQNLSSVCIGVGGSFDVISGNVKRAPLWIQKLNLEWAFRLIQEPRRLFKRYFWGNIVFIAKIIVERLKKR